jgi:hypothetical protein
MTIMMIRIRRFLLVAIVGVALVAPVQPATTRVAPGDDSSVPAPAATSPFVPDTKATTNPVCGTCV